MQANLQDVQQLISKLNVTAFEQTNLLTYSDRQAIQEVFNIEHYLLSNASYNAGLEISMLKQLIDKCSPKVAEHLKAFLASL